ncbi:hypothetical protein E2C01_044173 [Portunus trituberculatus]|uniref:Uncharacterized protein n=1 Tax=Portunus trituberculatus TaxID=210409 RepID=A0A5B7FYD2_PORTR|nr:hypothetical protein [Portunus trituberculatus]
MNLFYLNTDMAKPTHSKVKRPEYGSVVIINGSACTSTGLGPPLPHLHSAPSKLCVIGNPGCPREMIEFRLVFQPLWNVVGLKHIQTLPTIIQASKQPSNIQEPKCCET